MNALYLRILCAFLADGDSNDLFYIDFEICAYLGNDKIILHVFFFFWLNGPHNTTFFFELFYRLESMSVGVYN